MNELIVFEEKIKNALLKINSEDDVKSIQDLLSERHNWYISLEKDKMEKIYSEYQDSNKRLVSLISELKLEIKNILITSTNNHRQRQKYRLYE